MDAGSLPESSLDRDESLLSGTLTTASADAPDGRPGKQRHDPPKCGERAKGSPMQTAARYTKHIQNHGKGKRR